MGRDSYAVEVEGVAKRFGPITALDKVTLRIPRGEVFGLLGPNGAGKTTLIRSLVGLVAPEAGTVTVLGQRMPQLDVLARVGYMTQQAALYPDLSAEENVRFFGAISGRVDGVREALELVDLWDRRRTQGEGRRRAVGGRVPQAVRGFGIVSAHRVRAITRRLLQQFRRDRRTLVLLFGAPLVILSLLGYLLRGGGDVPKMGVVNLDGSGLGSVVA